MYSDTIESLKKLKENITVEDFIGILQDFHNEVAEKCGFPGELPVEDEKQFYRRMRWLINQLIINLWNHKSEILQQGITDSRLIQLEQQLEKYQADISKIAPEEEELNSTYKQLQDTKAEYEHREAEYQKLREQCDTLSLEVEKKKREFEELQSEIKKYKVELPQLSKNIEDARNLLAAENYQEKTITFEALTQKYDGFKAIEKELNNFYTNIINTLPENNVNFEFVHDSKDKLMLNETQSMLDYMQVLIDQQRVLLNDILNKIDDQ